MPGVVGVYTADDLEFPSAPAFMLLHPDTGHNALGTGSRELRGRSGRGRRRRDARASRRRRGARRRRLRAARRRHRHGSGTRVRRAAAVRVDRLEHRHGHADGPTGDALDGADVVVRGRFENQRVAVVPMEGSAIAVVPRRRRLRPRRAPGVPDAAHDPRGARGLARHRRRATPRDRAQRRRLVRREAHLVGGCRHRQGRDGARSPGEVGGDPLREHDRDGPRSRPGAVRRARPEA